MSDPYSLTLKEIAHRLHIGESTLNVWRNRYKEWMPGGDTGPAECYSQDILDVFKLIARCTQAGFENQEIERILHSMVGGSAEQRVTRPETAEKTRVGIGETEEPGTEKSDAGLKDVLSTLQDLMKGVVSQQERIASAQERRAAAQERMAFAMESQAENEMVKTEVMRELVAAIQDVSMKSSVSSLMERVKNTSCPSPAELDDFSHDMGFDMDNLEELSANAFDDRDLRRSTFDFDETAGTGHSFPESAPDSVSTDDGLEKSLSGDPDDFSFHSGPLDHDMEPDVDNLSALLDPEDMPNDNGTDAFAFSAEYDESSDLGGMDDLSVLLEPEDMRTAGDMDDLSALLEPEDMRTAGDMDDLSALLEPEDLRKAEDMDDLSLLLEPDDKSPSGMDDLSMLIDDEPNKPSGPISPDPVKPKETKAATAATVDENYKSRILKRIILLKQKEKQTVEDVVRLFNDEGVKTFSGKDTWDIRTIQGIFKYIDSFS